jgi:hypothetical protein
MRRSVHYGIVALLLASSAMAQTAAWREATPSELASVVPSRASVVGEHIETEARTASGIVDRQGRFVAGAVLITAGYSAEGKYSHYLTVQVPIEIGGVELKPGEYVFGWDRMDAQDALRVHFNDAATGKLIGVGIARRISGSSRVESLRIWPPADKSVIQIGRFGLAYRILGQ